MANDYHVGQHRGLEKTDNKEVNQPVILKHKAYAGKR